MLKRILRPLIPVLAALPVAAFLLIAGQDQDEIALCAVLGLALVVLGRVLRLPSRFCGNAEIACGFSLLACGFLPAVLAQVLFYTVLFAAVLLPVSRFLLRKTPFPAVFATALGLALSAALFALLLFALAVLSPDCTRKKSLISRQALCFFRQRLPDDLLHLGRHRRLVGLHDLKRPAQQVVQLPAQHLRALRNNLARAARRKRLGLVFLLEAL